ncbi:MAG: hypothetical protein K0R27_323 [Xanthobacteraceae bacterium]|jgi:hypothetical protein|nr:hypothetical protein [Xanthobacteraceae bacterium]
MIELPPPLILPERPALVVPGRRLVTPAEARGIGHNGVPCEAFMPGVTGVVGTQAPLLLTYLQRATPNSNDLSTYIFSGQNFGAEASDRYLIASIISTDNPNARSFISCSIGGVAATKMLSLGEGAASSNVLGFYGALVPTGTSGAVSVTFNSTMQVCGLTLYRATGLRSLTPFDSDTVNTAATPLTLTIDIPSGGMVLAAVWGAVDTRTTWTNATENDDANIISGSNNWSNASASRLNAQTGRAVSSSATSRGLAGSWR